MAKTKISEFSATPASNTDIDSINIAEGCAPSGINDAIRELMAQLKDFQTGAVGDSFNGPVGTTTAAAGAFTTLAASGAVTLSGGTANGVPYLNGSKVLTSGSALVFDGSNLGLGVTPSAWATFKAIQVGPNAAAAFIAGNGADSWFGDSAYYNAGWKYALSGVAVSAMQQSSGAFKFYTAPSGTAGNAITFTQAMTLDASGNLLVGTTNADPTFNNVAGISLEGSVGSGKFSRSNNAALDVNRKTNDGELVRFYQDGTQEGSISVSGTTVSYNGGHLSRSAQTITAKDESLVKGTVLSNLDEMNIYTDVDGNPVDNEQLNKVKVSDAEGDANVAGVFVNWTHDDAHNVDEINMAMTGDMIIRIAQGVTVQRGDLLMSAGDGTAKPQGDDIVRSKTVAKVTSTHVTCTYADGSFCVPCVLMAC